MKINLTKQTVYKANCPDLPGAPPIGTGDTPEAAVARLMLKVFTAAGNWNDHIDPGHVEIEYTDD